MKKIGFVLAGVFVLLIAAILIIPSLVPSSVYKEKIETQLTRELQREVTVQGDIKVAVFPSIRAKTGRVIIDNPDGYDAENFAAMDGLEARVALLPLLSRRVEIKAFELINPEINLQKLADGSANWEFGDTDSADSTPPPSGPFKRDGRYDNIDPSIGQFSLQNGRISYQDDQNGSAYDIRDANLDFSLPSLDRPVEIDGRLVFNDQPVKIDLKLDTIRAFLRGQEAPVSIDFETGFADLSAKGRFLPGEDIAFNLDIDGEISDMSAISGLLPTDFPVSGLAQTVRFSGNYTYENAILSARGAELRSEGPYATVDFSGDATLAEAPILDGRLELDAQDVAALAGLLELDMPALDLIERVNLTAALSAAEGGFSAEDLSAQISGDGLTASFDGEGSYGEILAAQGRFTSDLTSIASLLDAFDIDAPQAAAIDSAAVSGSLNMTGDDFRIDFDQAKAAGDHLNLSYTGQVIKQAESLSLDGGFEGRIDNVSQLAVQTGQAIPYADALGAISASGQISGTFDRLALEQIDARLTDGQINGTYTGRAELADGLNLSGRLQTKIPSLRALASTTGTQLPPSTDVGPIYETVSLSGNVTGSPEAISFDDANLAFDAITGTGDFNIDLAQARPLVRGNLDLSELDLRPYMAGFAAQNPSGEIQPWSEEPINTAPIKAIDGQFDISTPGIKTGRLNLGQTDFTATLDNGVLSANIPQLNMYGGLGSLDARVDASGAVPQVALNVKMNDLNSNRFLAAVAGFTKASGDGRTLLDVQGQGLSQAAIMKSLNGSGNFELLNGEISGIDLTEFMTGIDQAFSARRLPGGIGRDYTTKFRDIAGLFSIQNGVATVNDFNMDAFGVAASGRGQIDLGNQSIDFSLRPRLTGEAANDLTSFGIPIRLKGDFGNVSAGLDSELLANIVAEKAKAKLLENVTGGRGSGLGDVVGGLLGDRTSSGEEARSDAANETEAGAPGSNSRRESDAVNDLLGTVLGGNRTRQPAKQPGESAPTDPENKAPDEEPAEDGDQEEDPTLDSVLGSIFGQRGSEDED